MDTPSQHKSELKAEDLSYNFDELINSPDAANMINSILEGERKKMNTMSLSEFSQYERLFQYNGMEILGEQQFKALATQYFHTISVYDPVTVMDGDQVAFVLPPIFNRFTPIGCAGQTGADINQAFINACNSDDPMVRLKLQKYTEFYKRMISIVNDEDVRQKNEEAAHKQAEKALSTINQQVVEEKKSGEIEDIKQSNLKDSEVESLSDGNYKSKNEGNDEFEPL